jgi:hypothetical protein
MPTNLGSALAFWFDPTSFQVEGSVARWRDVSGNGNDAIQTNKLYEPIYGASSINSVPSWTFIGPIMFLSIADNASIEWGTSDFAIFAVVRATAQTAPNAMIYQKTGAYPYDGGSLYLNADKPVATTLAAAQVSGATYVVSASPPATFVDGTAHVLGARRAGTTLEVRVDVASIDVSAAGFDAIIGQNGYGTPSPEFQQFQGAIAEVIGVRGALAEPDVEALEQYLKSRYAVP